MRFVLLASVFVAGCASLPDDGALMCAVDPSRRCPSGFECADDDRCYRVGHLPSSDMSVDNGDLGDNGDMSVLPGSDLSSAPDMTVICGRAGQPCCTGPFSPCVTGTACSATSMTCEANDIWVFGTDVNISAGTILPIAMHYDGTNWTLTSDFAPANSGQNGFAIWGNSPSNFWAVGDQGNIFEYIGNGSWITCKDPGACPSSGVMSQLTSVYGANSGDIWVAGGGSMLHFEGGQWFPRANGLPTTTYWNVSWASSPTDVWTATGAGVARWNGTAWTLDTSVTSTRAIWGSAANDVWVVGDNVIRHWDGQAWSQPYGVDGQAVNSFLMSISGSGPNDIWVSGYHNANNMSLPDAFHWDGMTWHAYPYPSGITTNAAGAVWTASPKQAWLLQDKEIWYWNGTAWSLTALSAAQQKGWASIYGSANAGK